MKNKQEIMQELADNNYLEHDLKLAHLEVMLDIRDNITTSLSNITYSLDRLQQSAKENSSYTNDIRIALRESAVFHGDLVREVRNWAPQFLMRLPEYKPKVEEKPKDSKKWWQRDAAQVIAAFLLSIKRLLKTKITIKYGD